MNKLIWLAFSLSLFACSSFKAERVDGDKSDKKSLEITDNWVVRDTEQSISEVVAQMRAHKGFQRFLGKTSGAPKVFIADVQNNTSEPYFPIQDLNDELLNELSQSGDFVLVDADARDRILKEITYQNDGMVDPATAKTIGKQTGANLLIFGSINMKPERRGKKTLKEYTVNIRMTDIEKGVEVLRTRTRVNKYSEGKTSGW